MSMSPDSGPKLFTLDEANALVPFLEDRFDRFHTQLSELEEVRRELAVLRLVSASGGDEDNPDRRALEALENRAQALADDLNRIQREVLEAGCVPKSFREGLVDFFALRGERLVFLCWRRGEARVEHWHTLDGGFGARRPLRTLEPPPRPSSPPGEDEKA